MRSSTLCTQNTRERAAEEGTVRGLGLGQMSQHTCDERASDDESSAQRFRPAVPTSETHALAAESDSENEGEDWHGWLERGSHHRRRRLQALKVGGKHCTHVRQYTRTSGRPTASRAFKNSSWLANTPKKPRAAQCANNAVWVGTPQWGDAAPLPFDEAPSAGALPERGTTPIAGDAQMPTRSPSAKCVTVRQPKASMSLKAQKTYMLTPPGACGVRAVRPWRSPGAHV